MVVILSVIDGTAVESIFLVVPLFNEYPVIRRFWDFLVRRNTDLLFCSLLVSTEKFVTV